MYTYCGAEADHYQDITSSPVLEMQLRHKFLFKTDALVNEWTREELRAFIRLLWTQNTEPMYIHGHTVTV